MPSLARGAFARGSIHVGLTLIGALILATGCHRSKAYNASVEVTRVSVVRRDDGGKPLTTDFEFSYAECPGTQIETVRGDAAFSACVARYSVGQKIPVSLEHHWTDEGHYVWTVHKLGDCDRTLDPADEASFTVLRECEDWRVNGAKVGFQCDLQAEKKLVQQCPWFRRH